MAKYLVSLALICCIFGVIVVKGEFDKQAAIADFMTKADECKTEVGGQESDVAELIAKQPASTSEGKCLRSCLMKKYEVMDANGKFAPAVAVKHAEMYTEGDADKMKTAHEIIDACSGLGVPDDHCAAAEEYGKCFKEQAVAHGLPNFDL